MQNTDEWLEKWWKNANGTGTAACPTCRQMSSGFYVCAWHQARLEDLKDHIAAERADVEKAYGGCHNCYGKGYASVNNRWSGNDTDTDIGSPGGHVSGGNPNAMKFCDCARGQKLKKRFTSQQGEKKHD